MQREACVPSYAKHEVPHSGRSGDVKIIAIFTKLQQTCIGHPMWILFQNYTHSLHQFESHSCCESMPEHLSTPLFALGQVVVSILRVDADHSHEQELKGRQ